VSVFRALAAGLAVGLALVLQVSLFPHLAWQGTAAPLRERVGQLRSLSDAIGAAFALDVEAHPTLSLVSAHGPALWIREMVARYVWRRREAGGLVVHHVESYGDWYYVEWADGTHVGSAARHKIFLPSRA